MCGCRRRSRGWYAAGVFIRMAASLLAFGVLSAPLNAQPAAPGAAALTTKVDAIFKDFDKPTSPGCAVAVYQDDSIVYKRAYGMANLDHDIPLTPASVFHV